MTTSDISSPTRRYIVSARDPLNTSMAKIHEITVPELYVNDVTGAVNYYFDKIADPNTKVIDCVSREKHLERIRAKERELTIKKANVSPTRTYVLIARKVPESDKHLHKITLPNQYENHALEARRYFVDMVGPGVMVLNCFTYENYPERILENLFEDPFKGIYDTQNTNPPYIQKMQETLFNKNGLINQIKVSLADFYAIETYIKDEEMLNLIHRLENENLKYLGILSTINLDLKTGMEEIEYASKP